jgi:hypothetical protein
VIPLHNHSLIPSRIFADLSPTKHHASHTSIANRIFHSQNNAPPSSASVFYAALAAMVLPSAHSAIHKAVGCMLYDERLRGRFHSLKTVRSLANQIAPDGLVMKFDKIYRAFAISDDYVEYSFDDSGLNDYIDSPTGTILALRRVTKEGGKTGKYTAIGCFLSAKDVPGAEAVKRLTVKDPGIKVSARGNRGLFVRIRY